MCWTCTILLSLAGIILEFDGSKLLYLCNTAPELFPSEYLTLYLPQLVEKWHANDILWGLTALVAANSLRKLAITPTLKRPLLDTTNTTSDDVSELLDTDLGLDYVALGANGVPKPK